MLLDAGADVNCRDKMDNTATMVAAAVGHYEILRIMANHPQVDLNAQVSCFILTGRGCMHINMKIYIIANSCKFVDLLRVMVKILHSIYGSSHDTVGLLLYTVYWISF